MRNEETQHLRGLLNQHTPLSILREDYAKSLALDTVTVNGSTRWVSNTTLAKFMLSNERKLMDKAHLDKKFPLINESIDDSYQDPKGRL